MQNATSENPDDFFASLGVYLTLERAQRLYGFDAEQYGLDDAAAADIAAVFARVGRDAAGLAAGDFRASAACKHAHSHKAVLPHRRRSTTSTMTASCSWTSSAACAPRTGWS